MSEAERTDTPKHSEAAVLVKGVSRPGRPRKERIRVVIADDDATILDQVARLLEKHFDVVGRARNGRDLLDVVQRLSPSVVVTDITMPELTGIEATSRIKKTSPHVKVVILSVHSDSAIVDAAFAAGASGYVVKLRAASELIPAIQEVLAGRSWRTRDL